MPTPSAAGMPKNTSIERYYIIKNMSLREFSIAYPEPQRNRPGNQEHEGDGDYDIGDFAAKEAVPVVVLQGVAVSQVGENVYGVENGVGCHGYYSKKGIF